MAGDGQSSFTAEEEISKEARTMPEYRSASSTSSQFKTLAQPGQAPPASCTACGKTSGDGETLHRLKQDGILRHHCSRCVLFHNKGMYCSICLMVYGDASELGDPALWLTCSKCERLSHLECARARDIPTDSLFFTCHDCTQPKKAPAMESSGNSDDGPHKKPRLSNDSKEVLAPSSSEETLAAAKIVAILAVKHAKDAKIKARTFAAASAKAAAHAKAALDAAYRAAVEEARYRQELPKTIPYPGKVMGTPPYTGPSTTTTTMRGILSIHEHPRPLNHDRIPVKNYTIGSSMSKSSFTAPYPKVKSSNNSVAGGSQLLHKVHLSEQKPRQDKPPTLPTTNATAVASASPASILNSTSVLEKHPTSTLPDRGETGNRIVTAHCPLPQNMVADDMFDVVSAVAGVDTVEPAIDDFVDVGLLLEEECGKEKMPDALEQLEGGSVQKDPIVVETVSGCLAMNKEGSDFQQSTNDDSFVQFTDQLKSSNSSAEQGKSVHDDNALLATEVH